jgi:RHS repeat-associated protein
VSYPGGPTVSYTYDAAGNRKTEMRGGSTTNYAYDATGQLVTVGNKTYTYDANGNLTQAGTDSFSWDYDNRLRQATVGTHAASYTYDGDGVRVGATVDGSAKSYLVDTRNGLPTLVDDGSKAYLHADGVLSEVGTGGATQLLGDALGSVRGLADGNGSLVGTRSYEAFGSPRVMSGSSSLFGFTGEPIDATGLVYLRARSLDPATGRFLSVDTVQPNAPGTQGFNVYAYVAGNPATWTDPSGHMAEAIALAPWLLPGAGQVLLTLGVVALAVIGMYLMARILMCLVDTACRAAVLEFMTTIAEAGASTVQGVIDWTVELLDAASLAWPIAPSVPVAIPNAAATPATSTTTAASLMLPKVVIGENSDERPLRVPAVASSMGAVTYNWKGYWGESFASRDLGVQIWLNRLWIRDMMGQGRIIIDIGIAPENEERSPFYMAELEETAGYPLLLHMPFP